MSWREFLEFHPFPGLPETLQNLSVIFAPSKGVLCPTSQSRFRSTAPLKRGAIDKEVSFRSNTRCCDKTSPPQSLPLSGEVARRRRDGEVWPAPPAKASHFGRGGIERSEDDGEGKDVDKKQKTQRYKPCLSETSYRCVFMFYFTGLALSGADAPALPKGEPLA